MLNTTLCRESGLRPRLRQKKASYIEWDRPQAYMYMKCKVEKCLSFQNNYLEKKSTAAGTG